jgi:hypothetical protein
MNTSMEVHELRQEIAECDKRLEECFAELIKANFVLLDRIRKIKLRKAKLSKRLNPHGKNPAPSKATQAQIDLLHPPSKSSRNGFFHG